MKIAIVVPSLANKGPILVCRNLVDGLRNLGHEVDVLYFDEKFEVSFTDCNIGPIKHAKLSSYDVIHSHGFRPDLYVSFYRRRIRGRVISTMHNYIFADLKYEYNFLIALVFGSLWLLALMRLDKIVVFNQHMKKYFSNFISSRKLFIAENGLLIDKSSDIDNSIIEKVLNFKGSCPLVMSIGSLNKRKNFIDVVRLSNHAPNVRFLIVGEGDQRRSLEESIEKHCLYKNVLLMKGFENARMLFSYADCNLITSKSEGLPLVFIEACCFGVPTLTTKLPFATDLQSVFPLDYFDSADLEKSERVLSSIIENKVLLKLKYQELYKNIFSQSVMTKKYISIYNEV
jgi:L-malate glycosyltransferase